MSPVPPRPRHSLRFADGMRLELGRRTAVMGILNVTPDSFSDGGRFASVDAAVEHGLKMHEDGAAIVDVGGESTRPGAAAVDIAHELERVVPVIEALRRRSDVRISVDTLKPEVARRAFDSGADMLNDVTGLADPEMLDVVRAADVPAVVMHMRGTPRTMQDDTHYGDVVLEVLSALRERVEAATRAGLGDDKIAVDPGIGFGKSPEGNLAILDRLNAFAALERPVLVGASRKTFIGAVLDAPVNDRLEGSLAVATLAAAFGAHVIRAHDVLETVRAVRIVDAMRECGER